MSDRPAPKRAVYKAAEVCEIAGIKPYVLRSWESEFPSLGVAREGSVSRLYRQADLEQVLRIRQLVFEQGLTLGGARRRLEEERSPQPDLLAEEAVTPAVRDRIDRVRQGLKDLLVMLSPQDSADASAKRVTAAEGSAAQAGQSAPEPPAQSERAARPRKRSPSGTAKQADASLL